MIVTSEHAMDARFEGMFAADYVCPACRQAVEAWGPGPGGRPNASCTECTALERHRFLSLVLRQMELYLATAHRVLEYAPQVQIQKVLHELVGTDRYVGIDFLDERYIGVRADACQLPFRDASFDLIVQFHVLEHIPDDHSAICEMRRVIAPGGRILLQVPQRSGVPTDEDPDAPPEERTRRFGQHDHVRMYGDDFEGRLRAGGLTVRKFQARELIPASARALYGIPGENPLHVCTR